jgi:hypothetical protein
MRVLLRFPDLKQYGVRNWPTLTRWVQNEGAPAGFYIAANTRAWFQDEWDAWLASRPQAGDRPPRKAKPGPSVGAEETGRTADNTKHPLDNASPAACQVPNGRAGA